eukprot:4673672-Amphidinium_carterae.1
MFLTMHTNQKPNEDEPSKVYKITCGDGSFLVRAEWQKQRNEEQTAKHPGKCACIFQQLAVSKNEGDLRQFMLEHLIHLSFEVIWMMHLWTPYFSCAYAFPWGIAPWLLLRCHCLKL